MNLKYFEKLLIEKENEHLEFKEARNKYDFENLVKYCAALANEKGGKIILGISDKIPRVVTGSEAFSDIEQVKIGIIDRLHLRVHVESFQYEGKFGKGRVIVVESPSRPIGMPIAYKGAYWMRGGESLIPMTQDMIKNILYEGQPDFSAEICPRAVFSDLDPEAIAIFRKLWYQKSLNKTLLNISDKQLLQDAELIFDDQITYAALVLFGFHRSLGRFLPQAEITFEYRTNEASIPSHARKDFRKGFFLIFEELWHLINLRNEVQHYQDKFFIGDIPTFNKIVVREAILNSVAHRDYRLAGSIFFRQFPKKIEFISPGGLPDGITPQNIIYAQYPRNRRIAESFLRCGLVEKSGQGFDTIISQNIQESKALPDFDKTNSHQVYLVLDGTVQDDEFLCFLNKVRKETKTEFTVEDFMVMDLIHREKKITGPLMQRIEKLLDAGVIEKLGKGRGSSTKYILSKRFYSFTKNKGTYTRRRGLSRDQNKAFILQHLKNYGKATFLEFQDVLPALSKNQIKTLLQELKKTEEITFKGRTKRGFWILNESQNN